MPRRRWIDPEDSRIRPDRHVVPQKLAARLHRAATIADDALEERDRLIVEALRMGCSSREIAAHVGMSHTQVRRIGLAAGWPPKKP